MVDKSRGEKLVVNLNITFPRVPCYRTRSDPLLQRLLTDLCTVLSVDIMDISGEHQNGALSGPREAEGVS